MFVILHGDGRGGAGEWGLGGLDGNSGGYDVEDGSLESDEGYVSD